MYNSTVEEYNLRLVRLYGSLNDFPKYRIVRAELELEKRFVKDKQIFSPSGIFLKTESGIFQQKKYPWIPNCWLLERVEMNTDARKELVHEKYTYEPLFPFIDNAKNPIPLNWTYIDFIASRLEYIVNNHQTPKTPGDIEKEEELRMEMESNKIRDYLETPDKIKELPTFKSSTLIPKG